MIVKNLSSSSVSESIEESKELPQSIRKERNSMAKNHPFRQDSVGKPMRNNFCTPKDMKIETKYEHPKRFSVRDARSKNNLVEKISVVKSEILTKSGRCSSRAETAEMKGYQLLRVPEINEEVEPDLSSVKEVPSYRCLPTNNVNMDKEVNIPSLEDSFEQKPIISPKRNMRRRSQALPYEEREALGFDITKFVGEPSLK
mmetsp:Transcript_11778/g.10418  ORF Transcript_11778/g.10418 Transcript_11778/m.10418 type:complete len:200 (+) Transcript_11778:221-820(+)|eukprot:CAMPEP_0205800508 /NCGR_PEP_ID=MMETSP0205-20121125/2181_1 /ASSEMBLY_ACC=CAM_ASM_000278 /TAXON_ID=36767 /ORGANISM="Euplotes focardii, Strain TN1" /LENGTH=199 /DNA_ID=CAMNT_0053063695 /DNA_START=203 /DNA_END=802 /DNA_ORIENTATION=-